MSHNLFENEIYGLIFRKVDRCICYELKAQSLGLDTVGPFCYMKIKIKKLNDQLYYIYVLLLYILLRSSALIF